MLLLLLLLLLLPWRRQASFDNPQHGWSESYEGDGGDGLRILCGEPMVLLLLLLLVLCVLLLSQLLWDE
jgi:hypothetical protein